MATRLLGTGSARLTLAKALSRFRGALFGLGLMSSVINVLTLTGSFFMLQLYDRVIPSKSVPTLVGLAILAGTLFLFQGALELMRSRLLVRLGLALDSRLSGPVFAAAIKLPTRVKLPGDGLQPLRDLDQVRSFLSSQGPTALFDMPWVPLYVFICFVFHFWIGVTAIVGAILLLGLTFLAERKTTQPIRQATGLASSRNALAEATRRNTEALQAMGFAHRINERWSQINAEYLETHARASDVAGTLSAISKFLRTVLQSAILAVGAYLVIRGEASGGIMIASSIMMSRALAPIELAITYWKGFVSARQSWTRLKQLLAAMPESDVTVNLPSPEKDLSVQMLSVVPPGDKRLVVQDVSFDLSKGEGLGVIGPSASGKSSLARAIAGVWMPHKGSVRLDGSTLDQWTAEQIGASIGYLPQDVQLFDGTIGENIARFEPDASSGKILRAAHTAGVHDMIVHFPEGYDTVVGEAGSTLSAGQRQRIALARALYGDPFLVILDEPNSNLDGEGETALTNAIKEVRSRGGIVIVIAHRQSALECVDKVLLLAGGRMHAFGPKAEVLNKLVRQQTAPTPLKVVGDEGG